MKIFQNIRGLNNSKIVNSNISMNGNKANINGKTYDIPSGNISIINGVVFVNGKKFNTDDAYTSEDRVINIQIEGNVENVNCNGNIEVKGNVGEIDCGGSATIIGDIKGSVDCGGSCSIRGIHVGSIDAGGSVSVR